MNAYGMHMKGTGNAYERHMRVIQMAHEMHPKAHARHMICTLRHMKGT
jgi:hypothetical protein